MGNGEAQPTDLELVNRSRDGDDSAYATIVRRYQRAVRATAARFLDSPDDVDDLAQDCFVQAYEQLHRFRGEGSFEGWLRRIAVRLCYDRLRVAARSRIVSNGLDEAELERVAAAVANPTDPADEVEMRDLTRRLLARLRPADRMVLELQIVEGYSVKEIAAMTGWGQILVRVRASRARERAARLVEQMEANTPAGRRDSR